MVVISEKTLFDIYGNYLRCEGKRPDKSRHLRLRLCCLPSITHCEYCGVPLCNKCDITLDRHKRNCKGRF